MEQSCPQCQEALSPKSRLIREEICGHLKCRNCLLDEEDGCRQCIVEIKEEDHKREENVQEEYDEVGYESILPDEEVMETEEIIEEEEQEEEYAEVENENYLVEKIDEDDTTSPSDTQKISAPMHVIEIWVMNVHTSEAERQFKCNLCQKTFRSIHQIRYHAYCDPDVEKPQKCSECSESFRTGYQLKQHMHIHQNAEFKCSECDKTFAHDASAKKHMKKHFETEKVEYSKKPIPTGEYPCDICQKVFARRDYLKKHMICHSETKRFICTVCDKRYMRYNALKFHIQSTHEKIEEFACERCSKTFSSVQSLQRHIATHTNTVKLACKICGLRSTRKDNLMRHIRSFHPTEDQRNSIIYNPTEDIIKIEELDQLNTDEIRQKEAHLRKNVIVEAPQYVEEHSDEMYMPVDSLEGTIVVLGMPPLTEKKDAKKDKEEKRRLKKDATMDIYRKILLEQEEDDETDEVIIDDS